MVRKYRSHKRRAPRGTRTIAKKALKIARSAKGVQEVKLLETNLSGLAVTQTFSQVILNAVTLGDGISHRDGQKITCRSVEGNLFFASNGPSVARFWLIWDKQNTFSPATNFVIAGGGLAPISLLARSDRHRYIVLHDSGPIMLNAAVGLERNFKVSRKINKKTMFVNDTNSMVSGLLRLVYVSDDAAAGVTQLAHSLRLNFYA